MSRVFNYIKRMVKNIQKGGIKNQLGYNFENKCILGNIKLDTGINVHQRENPNTDYSLIKEYGFTLVRDVISWDEVESVKGQYDFKGTNGGLNNDEFIAILLENELRPYIAIVGYNSNNYITNQGIEDATAQDAFAKFCGVIAGRYKEKGIIWEIQNESNLNIKWSPESYGECAIKAAKKIKQNDPSALVYAPALALNDEQYLERMFKTEILNWIDGISLHPYRPSNPETVLESYQSIRNIIKKYSNRDIPIIQGEWGYSTPSNWDGSESNAVTDIETQAKYLTRISLISYYQKIPINIIYDWQNDGMDSSKPEQNFGIVEQDLVTPKPAALALKVLNTTLKGFYFLERINLNSTNDYLLKFINSKFKAVFVFWTTDEEHEFTLLFEKSIEGSLKSMLGIEKGKINNSYAVLFLKGEPQYLLLDSEDTLNLVTRGFLEEYVNNFLSYKDTLPSGFRNIVKNSAFNNGLSHWGVWKGDNSIDIVEIVNDSQSPTGYACYIKCSSGRNTGVYFETGWSTIPMNIGDIYTISLVAKGSGRLFFGQENKTIINLTEEYSVYTGKIVNSGGNITFFVDFGVGESWIHSLKVSAGSNIVEWFPAPEDILEGTEEIWHKINLENGAENYDSNFENRYKIDRSGNIFIQAKIKNISISNVKHVFQISENIFRKGGFYFLVPCGEKTSLSYAKVYIDDLGKVFIINTTNDSDAKLGVFINLAFSI
ncbi:glycoside hydrolase family 5 protein [Priestia megaterium]|uniref:cellulase family glycosylhydrolase n=1 Tax=Priestia megaterium TaxID=1404 RepID=UPI001C2409F1|nr:cellulase family glycosylhydrolase [Priestia megaterium]MBU8686477.1 glycoside hydrolase family 5 protein [Priestia megaterium]